MKEKETISVQWKAYVLSAIVLIGMAASLCAPFVLPAGQKTAQEVQLPAGDPTEDAPEQAAFEALQAPIAFSSSNFHFDFLKTTYFLPVPKLVFIQKAKWIVWCQPLPLSYFYQVLLTCIIAPNAP